MRTSDDMSRDFNSLNFACNEFGFSNSAKEAMIAFDTFGSYLQHPSLEVKVEFNQRSEVCPKVNKISGNMDQPSKALGV